MSRDARFWNRMAKLYFGKPIKDEEAYAIKLATTQDYLRPDMHILEVGCGTGGTAIAHAPHVAQVTATDISERMIGFAEQRKAEAGATNVTFATASVAESLGDEKHYDAVLMLSLLHLLEDPETTIRRAADVLAPGGHLVSNTPCLKGRLGAMGPALKLGGWLGLMPSVIQAFSEYELLSWIEAAGLRTVHHWRPDGGDSVFTISEKA